MFEEYIAGLLSSKSGAETLAEVRTGYAFVSCSQDESGVISVLEERKTKRKRRVHSKYVVACDGAKSAVRSYLNIKSVGEDSFETMMTIHFKADVRPVVGDRVGMLHWILDPVVSGFIIGYDLSGNMVLISNFDAQTHPVESWTTDHCLEVLRAAIGSDIPIEVLSYRPWVLSRKVAEQYRQGRVLL